MRIALVGCGDHGADVLLPAAREAGLEPVAVIDADLDRALDTAQRWHVADAYRSVEELPHGCVDAVLLALPGQEHAHHVGWALARDLPVFVEKPPASDPTELRHLHAEVRRSGGICNVGMNFRCADGVLTLRRILGGSTGNNPVYVRVMQLAKKPVNPFSAEASLEASLFHAQGIHAIDLAFVLMPDLADASGALLPVERGRLCTMTVTEATGVSRAEIVFGSCAAGLHHQVDVICRSGDMYSLRDLSELVQLPSNKSPEALTYPGGRVLWRRSPTTNGFRHAGYARELALFALEAARTASPTNSAIADSPPLGRGARLEDLTQVYDAYDGILVEQGLKWTA